MCVPMPSLRNVNLNLHSLWKPGDAEGGARKPYRRSRISVWDQGSLSDLSSGNSQDCAYSVAESRLQLQILSLSPLKSREEVWCLLSLLTRAFPGLLLCELVIFRWGASYFSHHCDKNN